MTECSLDAQRRDFYQGLGDFIRHGDPGGLDELFQPGFDLAVAAIYRNGFYRSCREVLVNTFASVHQVLGQDVFALLARNYADQHPPKQGTLTGYGQHFPEWLAMNVSPPQAWLAAVARLDRAWLGCLHGQDATPLSAQSLQGLLERGADVAQLSISLLPNAQLVSSTAEAFALWSDHKRGNEVQPPGNAIATEPKVVLMWRPEMTVFARSLSAGEYLFLSEVERHHTLDIASTSVLNSMPGFDLASHFAELLNNGVLQVNEQPASEQGIE